ncbi:HDOD domain-containing protein [Chitinimonas sp. BJB300]|uniref:HDOD domain-containing protein n=1 Tax=Chitinimonas sp. BJB300 TaxID=1559339 RepID=UPI000C0CA2F8|nr:HDOD domain-containing protein [Chitinimonas sp. BJB300]PHV11341.1 histidine kinase [Chitinimonas sp. BJB300]TSJ87486.1 HDOD domain-containing protein [Chitinimonas sp. BJB300]
MDRLLNDEDTAKLLKSLTLPSLPAVLSDLRAAQAHEAAPGELASIIRRDLSLSAMVLKAANSPSFGGGHLDSIDDALQFLGNANLSSLITGLALKRLIPLPPILGRFWDEATCVANIAASLSKQLRIGKAEQAYLFCLFRDCGIPVLTQRFPSYIATLARAMEHPARFVQIEEEARSTSHVIVGYLLARTWFLPEHLALAILYHHDFDYLQDESVMDIDSAKLIALARLAEHLLKRKHMQEIDSEWEQIGDRLLSTLSLSRDAFETAMELTDASA